VSSYEPVLYHRLLCRRCARVRRAIRDLGVEVELRSVLSRRHREELRQLAGQVRVPCLVVSGEVVGEVDEIEKYLRLRYGSRC
jgi:glutathione S-transferase